MTATGRMRVRPRLFGGLRVEVEEEFHVSQSARALPGRWERRTRWRAATLDDFEAVSAALASDGGKRDE